MGSNSAWRSTHTARYFLAWGRQAKAYATLGLKASQFARQQLDMLGIGQDLSRITYGVTYVLPPAKMTPQEPVSASA